MLLAFVVLLCLISGVLADRFVRLRRDFVGLSRRIESLERDPKTTWSRSQWVGYFERKISHYRVDERDRVLARWADGRYRDNGVARVAILEVMDKKNRNCE